MIRLGLLSDLHCELEPGPNGLTLRDLGSMNGTLVNGTAIKERVLHDGELVRFANHGFLVHMITAARGRNAAGARRIARLLQEGKAQSLATGFRPFDNILTRGACQQQVIRDRPGRPVRDLAAPPRRGADVPRGGPAGPRSLTDTVSG